MPSSSDHLTDLTAAAAARAIARKELSPTELTAAYLARIEQVNPAVNAYVTVTAERAVDDARRATDEVAAGQLRSALHGVPIGLKDLVDTAGITTAAGAGVYRDRVPTTDATVARKLRDAGTVLLGKLNTHELAFGTTTTNPHFGATHNPWKLGHIPGGSSGGSGAAMAAGLAGLTIGTDTGGSIRIPASFCGCVGLKPTYGRVSKAGIAPLSWIADHAGPITRTVEDAALLLEVISGYDPADFSTIPLPTPQLGLGDGIKGLRIGVPRSTFFALCEPDVAAAVEAALGMLQSSGAELHDIELPDHSGPVEGFFAVVIEESRSANREAWEADPDGFGPDLRALFSQPSIGGAAYAAALEAMYRYAEAVRSALVDVDVLVTPTTPITAKAIGTDLVDVAGTEMQLLMAAIACTAPFNIARVPALALPCGFSTEGLPISLQIIGRPFDEATALRVGHTYESATDWHTERATVPH